MGSEEAVGWNWALAAAKVAEVWVITSSRYRHDIETHLESHFVPKLRFVYVDDFQSEQSSQMGSILYRLRYVKWQFRAWKVARRVIGEQGIELAHHVTYVTYRYPTFVPFLRIPFVWGPLGGGEVPPIGSLGSLSFMQRCWERARLANTKLARFDPFVRYSGMKASQIVVVNRETANVLNFIPQDRLTIEPAIGVASGTINKPVRPRAGGEPISMVYAGLLIPVKRVDILIRSVAQLSSQKIDIYLHLFGDGPLTKDLNQLAQNLGVPDRVIFHGFTDRRELVKKYQEYDVFVYASIHDSGGVAILEAMDAGLPVVCVDIGGPGYIVNDKCGVKFPPGTDIEMIEGFVRAITQFAENDLLFEKLGTGAALRVEERFRWARLERVLATLYENAKQNPAGGSSNPQYPTDRGFMV